MVIWYTKTKEVTMTKSTPNLSDIKKEIIQQAVDSGYAVSVSRYTKAVDWLFAEDNKATILKHLSISKHHTIDYPDYFDLPKSISNKLTGDEVDLLQDMIDSQLRPLYAQDLANMTLSTPPVTHKRSKI